VTRPVVLSIAGSDSSGGAGIQADLKTMSAHGVHGATVITAITAQDQTGVRGWWAAPADAVTAQLTAALRLRPATIKTGMLGDGAGARAVIEGLREYGGPVVVDPVCRSTSGADLLDASAFALLRDELIPRSTLVTPNLAEAQALTGLSVTSPEDQEAAARRLVAMGAVAALVTGGHLDGEARDVLFDGTSMEVFTAQRIATSHTHGTGCVLSSAIASRLALGDGLRAAVDAAKAYVSAAIAAGYPVGDAPGPVDPTWPWRPVARAEDLPTMSDLELRRERYDSESAQRLIDEVQAEYVVRYGGPDEAHVDPDEFAPPQGLFLVGYLDGVPVATGGWRLLAPELAEIKRMYVSQSVRRRGLSRVMLAALEDSAREAGVLELHLITGEMQPEAIALYRSSGYVDVPPFGHYADAPMARFLGKRL
jgi:hydroxymethylpyrimidine/phosphomethylpyrimidine kinase